MSVELFNNGDHACVMFSDLVEDHGSEPIQSNQFLIVRNGCGILLDPGGVLTYNDLYIAMNRYFPPKQLKYLFASHADPDIIASLPRWLTASDTKVLISTLWSRFIPHFCPQGKTEGRIVAIPDQGSILPFEGVDFQILPAHFLHAEGNLQFYDPVSRILFSGDMGSSLLPTSRAAAPVEDFDAHVPHMQGFHARYMVSNRICRYWADMVREIDPEWIVPQHGAPFRGKAMVARFLDWIEALPCGVDLMSREMYRVPKGVHLDVVK